MEITNARSQPLYCSFNLLFGDAVAVVFCSRWLTTVSSTFQDVVFDGSLLPLFIT